MNLGLRGRTALVTGAAGGIGSAVARELAAEGVRVAVADRDRQAVRGVADDIARSGGDALALAADVTDEQQVAAAVADLLTRFGRLDLLVGCAGVSGPVGTRLVDTSQSTWDRVFAVNVTGSFLLLKHAIGPLRASDAASVVFVASDSALVATPGMTPYGASKAALLQFARAAAVELALDGIRVNAVCPSIVDTAMSRGDLGLEGFGDVGYPVQSAAEVAAQIVFLCSERARPVNAAALISDFGFTARSNFPA